MQNTNTEEPQIDRRLRYEWLHDGERWHADAVLEIDPEGSVAALRRAGPADRDLACAPGIALPGMANVHGHAFQRAMAGLAERRGPGRDSFWTWRTLMYRAADRLDGEALRVVVTTLYLELLEAGYTALAEFHYLHRPGHGPDRLPPAASAALHRDAAEAVGLPLTLLPVLYQRAGFRQEEPTAEQARFVLATDAYLELRRTLASSEGAGFRVGAAFHSLRAVAPGALREVLDALPAGLPVHVHVAEQTAEVEDCLRAHGRRPVAWLLDEFPVDGHWCLVHATHVGPAELAALAATGAVAGLCPLTEANLGDGFFPLESFLAADGRIGIGSDSHVAVDPLAELRCLEYGQRLRHRARNVAASEAEPHCGIRLWRAAAAGGARAVGRGRGTLAPGAPADLVRYAAPLPGVAPETTLDVLLFARDAVRPAEVRVAGDLLVRDGVHVRRAALAPVLERFPAVAAGLA